jgi:DNA-3-methyladenine glycosylase
VCEAEGTASAVLLRALEPVENIATMRERRGRVEDRELCSGPGKLCQALGITRELDGKMMPGSEVLVLAPTVALPVEVAVTPRIGITKAADWPLRFLVAGNPHVSGRPRAKV